MYDYVVKRKFGGYTELETASRYVAKARSHLDPPPGIEKTAQAPSAPDRHLLDPVLRAKCLRILAMDEWEVSDRQKMGQTTASTHANNTVFYSKNVDERIPNSHDNPEAESEVQGRPVGIGQGVCPSPHPSVR